MINVIETNLSLESTPNTVERIVDFQSRVIEVESWESLIEEIKNQETVTRNAYLGNMYGCTIPKHAEVYNLHISEYKIDCYVKNYAGMVTRKLIYKI